MHTFQVLVIIIPDHYFVLAIDSFVASRDGSLCAAFILRNYLAGGEEMRCAVLLVVRLFLVHLPGTCYTHISYDTTHPKHRNIVYDFKSATYIV